MSRASGTFFMDHGSVWTTRQPVRSPEQGKSARASDTQMENKLVMSRSFAAAAVVLMLFLIAGARFADAQDTNVVLPPVTVNVDNTVAVHTTDKDQAEIRNISTRTAGIVTAVEGGTNDVRITGRHAGVT